MNLLLHLDLEGQWFECQRWIAQGRAGCAPRVQRAFFPSDPPNGEYATFGGMYSTNASGAQSVKYGNVVVTCSSCGSALMKDEGRFYCWEETIWEGSH